MTRVQSGLPRLGAQQLATLQALGSPVRVLVTPSASDLRMVAYGYLTDLQPGLCITPDGLRRLAHEMEAGRVFGAMALHTAQETRGTA